MWSLVRLILFLVIVSLPFPSMASDTPVRIEKKPDGLRKTNPDKGNPYLTIRDRLLWRSVIKWCDECEEQARPWSLPMALHQDFPDAHQYDCHFERSEKS